MPVVSAYVMNILGNRWKCVMTAVNYSAALQWVSQNQNKLRARRTAGRSGNGFSVNVKIHVRERKFVNGSVDTRFVISAM